jgi:trehalose 6-phosphate phosphatase
MAEHLKDIRPLRQVLTKRDLGIFSDIDGTLAPIVDRPEDARVSPRCRALLSDLMSEGVGIVLITGRTLEMAQRMTNLQGVVFGANHGMTIAIDGREEVLDAVREYESRAREVYEQTSHIMGGGVFVEVTGPNLAYHYRMANDERESRETIVETIGSAPAARGFQMREGRKVIELRPALEINKGTALGQLADRLKAEAILCLGDDATDIDMFTATADLRNRGLDCATVAVSSEEAAPEVMANADYYVEGVPGVEWLLEEVLKARRQTSR